MELKNAFDIKELICRIFYLTNMKFWILSLPSDKLHDHLVSNTKNAFDIKELISRIFPSKVEHYNRW